MKFLFICHFKNENQTNCPIDTNPLLRSVSCNQWVLLVIRSPGQPHQCGRTALFLIGGRCKHCIEYSSAVLVTCIGGGLSRWKGGEGPDIWLRQWPSYTCISGATGLAHYCYSHSRRPATFDLSSDHNLFSHFRHAPRPSVRLSR